jgi:hypothetical protein
MIKEFHVTTNSVSWNEKTHRNLHVLQKVMFKYLTTCRFADNTDVSKGGCYIPFKVIASEVKPEAQTVYSPLFKKKTRMSTVPEKKTSSSSCRVIFYALLNQLNFTAGIHFVFLAVYSLKKAL